MYGTCRCPPTFLQTDILFFFFFRACQSAERRRVADRRCHPLPFVSSPANCSFLRSKTNEHSTFQHKSSKTVQRLRIKFIKANSTFFLCLIVLLLLYLLYFIIFFLLHLIRFVRIFILFHSVILWFLFYFIHPSFWK